MNILPCASVNRAADWHSICRDIFGWEAEAPPTKSLAKAPILFVDLTNPRRHNKEKDAIAKDASNNNNHENMDDNDHLAEFWSTAIHQVEENMDRMISWLQEKEWSYVSPRTSDEEASLIQSTIGSYTVTTANELENLRRHYQTLIQQQQQQQQQEAKNYPRSPQQQQHDMAMIQILSERLKERVAEPFNKSQKRRQRRAVQLWQEPLHCRYVPLLKALEAEDDPEEDDELDKVLGLSREEESPQVRDRRFHPTQPRISLGHEQRFLEAYNPPMAGSSPQMPESLFAQQIMPRSKRARPSSTLQEHANESSVTNKPLSPIKNLNEQRIKRTRLQSAEKPKQHSMDNENSGFATEMTIDAEELHQESVLLQARRQQHDLDAVQSMETTMVQITALLSQFSELVSNQQEEVWQIHDAVKDSKDNVEKGQDQLIDAKERTENSKHFMASAIFGMGVAMLFFHWVRP